MKGWHVTSPKKLQPEIKGAFSNQRQSGVSKLWMLSGNLPGYNFHLVWRNMIDKILTDTKKSSTKHQHPQCPNNKLFPDLLLYPL
jgi:hypothetical protein